MPLNGFDSICKERQGIIVSKDSGNRVKHIANNVNLNRVTHYRIDGFVITEGNRCDYLLINEDSKVAYLIELKGSDLQKAAIQLESTEKTLQRELHQYELKYRIVASRAKTHAIESVTFRRFKARKGLALVYSTNQIEETI